MNFIALPLNSKKEFSMTNDSVFKSTIGTTAVVILVMATVVTAALVVAVAVAIRKFHAAGLHYSWGFVIQRESR